MDTPLVMFGAVSSSFFANGLENLLHTQGVFRYCPSSRADRLLYTKSERVCMDAISAAEDGVQGGTQMMERKGSVWTSIQETTGSLGGHTQHMLQDIT